MRELRNQVVAVAAHPDFKESADYKIHRHAVVPFRRVGSPRQSVHQPNRTNAHHDKNDEIPALLRIHAKKPIKGILQNVHGTTNDRSV